MPKLVEGIVTDTLDWHTNDVAAPPIEVGHPGMRFVGGGRSDSGIIPVNAPMPKTSRAMPE